MTNGKDKKAAGHGMFEEPEKEEPRKFTGMFEADRAAHKMTKRKERIIVLAVIAAAVLIAAFWIVLAVRGERELLRDMLRRHY